MRWPTSRSGCSVSVRNTPPRWNEGPDGHAFDVVSAPIGTTNAEFRAVATYVASLDTLDAFLSDMRKRYPDLNAISGKGGPAKRGAAAPKDGAADNAAKDAGKMPAPKLSPPGTVTPKDAGPSADASQKTPTSERAAVNAPGKPANAAPPVPPKVPQGVPLVPDRPTGSI